MPGSDADFALGAGFALGGDCELVHGGKLLLDHDLAGPRKLFVVAQLRLVSWRACAWPQLTSLLVPLLFVLLPVEH